MSVDTHSAQNEEHFNLLDEPWILVRNMQGEAEELSVLELFKKAHELDCLEGESPTQNVAILRFLLAILYAVFIQVDENGNPSSLIGETTSRKEALRRWKALWDAPDLPITIIESYLEHYRNRFWLIHPTSPFYQVAGLGSEKAKDKDASQMIPDVPSRIERRFFSLRFGSGASTLSYSEAARWLICLHAWDYAGKKAVVTDALGNRGSENGGGTGWLGKLGVLYLKETNIAKTLLMNLVLFSESTPALLGGKPIWEEEPRSALKVERHPSGFVELLTQQSRRVLLLRQFDRVSGVTISYGDVFNKENVFVEQMSSWHESTEPSAGQKFIPTTHKPDRSLWRNLSSILPQAAGKKRVTAGVITWAGLLKEQVITEATDFSVVAVGTEYGDMQSSINEIISDELSLNASLLTALGDSWVPRIVAALDKTNDCIQRLGWLAQQLAKASGADDGSAEKKAAQENAYHIFDTTFRKWLASLNPECDDLVSRVIEWQDITVRTIHSLGQELFSNISSRALIGPVDEQKAKVTPAHIAYRQFRSSISKILVSWKEDASNE
jgi:CRISPR system Cascade subunit CasA